MEYKILTGENINEDFLEKIMEVDRECYAGEYVGELANMQVRYRKNKQSFVCVMDGERVAGYINFFPVVNGLWNDIVDTGMHIRDDDITADEVADFCKGEDHNLYILSVVIREQYRGKKQGQKPVVKILTDAFIDYLNTLKSDGYGINAIAATAVSDSGKKYLRNCMFGEHRQLKDGNIVYICDDVYLHRFLQNKLYFKTFHDDVYLFIPYVENPKNPKMADFLAKKAAGECEAVLPDVVQKMMEELDGCLKYEYNSDVVDELQRVALGDFQLMHTLDLYPDSPEELPHIVGEERVYVSLLAHQRSHMYVVMLFIPNCKYSTSQIEDQVSQKYLMIRNQDDVDQKGYYVYKNLNEYLFDEYGLIQCGNGKSILCMSKKPETDQEFLNILAGESYNSMRQDFFIKYPQLEERAKDNKAIYDYYEAYMTQSVLALIFGEEVFELDKSNPNCDKAEIEKSKERVSLTATYVFIVEMTMFQNIALNRVVNKVSRALSHDGDIDYDYVMQLNEDYAKTVKFWQSNNFKYFGTQREAEQIRRAFDNDEILANYRSQQEFLDHMVEVKTARSEHKSDLIMNIVLFMLAIVGGKDYIIQIIQSIYSAFNFSGDISIIESAKGTFDTLFLGIGPLIAVIVVTLRRKRYRENDKRLRKNKAEKKQDENKK